MTIGRDPSAETRTRRALDGVLVILNSLIESGDIILDGPSHYTLARPPAAPIVVFEDGGGWHDEMTIPGPAGATGKAGAAGIPGCEGPPGEDGLSIPGQAGVAGSNGATGAQGPTGTPLFILEDGPQGDEGVPGRIGSDGAAGTTGAQGPTGTPLFLLEDGPTGEDGRPGRDGSSGANGATGSQGPTGTPLFLLEDGPPGEDGRPGFGTTGATGATGAQGPTGTPLFLLEDGPPGEDGHPGRDGAAGANGATGAQGPAGPAIQFLDDFSYEDVIPSLPGSATTSTTTASSSVRGYIDGLLMSGVGGASSAVTYTAGSCRDSADTITFSVAAGGTKILAGTWAAGSGGNGLDTGVVAATTWYHVFAIAKADGSSGDLLFSLSVSSPTMPATYTLKRRIGSIFSTAGSFVNGFVQYGDEFLWLVGIQDVNTTVGTTATLYTLSVPTGVKVWAQIASFFGGTKVLLYSPDQSDEVPTGLIWTDQGVAGPGTPTLIRTDAIARVRGVASAAAQSIQFRTIGWIDPRGKDT